MGTIKITEATKIVAGKRQKYTLLQIIGSNLEDVFWEISQTDLHPRVLVEVLMKSPAIAGYTTARVLENLKKRKRLVFFYNPAREEYQEFFPTKKGQGEKVHWMDLEVNIQGGVWVSLMEWSQWRSDERYNRNLKILPLLPMARIIP